MKLRTSDYEWARFAIANRHRFRFTGSAPVEYPHGTVDGMRAFKMYDSNGTFVGTKHRNVAACLHNVKASVNLHIKMWAEGVRENSFALHEFHTYLEEINAPAWVADALHHASERGI